MRAAWRIGVLALLLFAVPLSARADVSALVWGDIVMLDGGTYSVPLNTPAPAYVTGPDTTPDGEWTFWLFGNLYKLTDSGREYVQRLEWHNFDDPDDPNDGDPLFAWSATGSYELDLHSFPPPQPLMLFENNFLNWLAMLVLGETAYAQFGEPIFLGTIHFTIEDSANSAPDPVIIIPGILGSEQHNGEWVIDPILHTYDDLIATFDENGYTPGVDLFPFPYNWRKSNVETALLMKQKIDEVKGICECDKVDLVAHSMGGLVARQYIQSDAYEHDVDQLIFLGTPHLGAPKAYLMWEGGEVGPFGLRVDYFIDFMMETILSLEAHERGYKNLFSYVRDVPIISVQQLLPTYDYISDGGVQRTYPDDYPVNEFLDKLNEGSATGLSSSGVRIYNLTGETGLKTVSGIDAIDGSSQLPKWEHGYPKLFDAPLGSRGLILGLGDGTVPTISASYIDSNLLILPFDHRGLVTGSSARVFNILTGRDVSVVVPEEPGLLRSLLSFRILSPADLLIVAPDGKKIGKAFSTGLEVNEIPNAFYTGFTTDTEFITILNPLDGDYQILTQGTGGGSYTVEADLVSDSTTTSASFTGNTGPGIKSELNLEVENGAIPPSALDLVVTYESTLADIDRIYSLGWMSKKAYRDIRDDFKDSFKKKKGKRVVDKKDLRDILEELEDYREDREISKQGYQILKANIEWLINN